MAVLNREDYKTAIPQLSKAITELREKVNNISYDITSSLKLYSISSERGYSKTIWVDLKGIPWNDSEYNVDGLDNSSSDELWVKSAIKAICARHPHETETIFRCSFAPNSRGILEVFIYDTDALYGGLPACFGTFRKYPTKVYSFTHTSSEVWTWHDIDDLATGAVPSTRTVNNKALSSDITLTASDVGAVPTTRTVNSKALSSNISLSASDVGAVPDSPTATITATDITVSGKFRCTGDTIMSGWAVKGYGTNDSTSIAIPIDTTTRGFLFLTGAGANGRGIIAYSANPAGTVTSTKLVGASAVTVTNGTNMITLANSSGAYLGILKIGT